MDSTNGWSYVTIDLILKNFYYENEIELIYFESWLPYGLAIS